MKIYINMYISTAIYIAIFVKLFHLLRYTRCAGIKYACTCTPPALSQSIERSAHILFSTYSIALTICTLEHERGASCMYSYALSGYRASTGWKGHECPREKKRSAMFPSSNKSSFRCGQSRRTLHVAYAWICSASWETHPVFKKKLRFLSTWYCDIRLDLHNESRQRFVSDCVSRLQILIYLIFSSVDFPNCGNNIN